jgi:1-phosphofructokinase family hexose kinase
MIICLGTTPALQQSMTFERLTLDAVNRASRTRQYASGKSINAARVIATMGHSVLAMGFLGGPSGQAIRSELAGIGIEHDFVEVPAATRVCVTAIDAAKHTATELVEEAAEVESASYEQLLARLKKHLPAAKVLVLSGSLPSGAPGGIYAACVALAAAQQVPVVLDASGEPLVEALAQRPRVAKPNREELEKSLKLTVRDVKSLLAAMQRLIDHGAEQVVISDGARPVFCTNGRSTWRLVPPDIQPISAIGSGDALAAGLAIGIEEGIDLPEAMKLGIACAAANALTPDAGHIDPVDVRRLQKNVVTAPA